MPARLPIHHTYGYFLILATTLTLSWSVGLSPAPAFADGTGDLLDTLSQSVLTNNETIRHWRSEGNTVMSIALMVGILGIISGALQGISHRWTKITTVAVGVLISVLTLFNHTYFDGDHRVLFKKASSGQRLMNNAQREIDRIRMGRYNKDNADDLSRIYDSISKFLDDFEALKEDLPIGTMRISMIASAYAVAPEEAPEWLIKTPESRNFIYLVGKGQGNTIREAQRNSVQDTKQQFHRYLNDNLKALLPASESNAMVDKLGSIADSYLKYQPDKGQYTAYQLVRFSKSVLLTDLLARDVIK